MNVVRYKPSQIANYFLAKAEKEGIALSQLKLIKLVYIAHGWALALLDRPLFEEPIEAWRHGPVIPSLYHEFKHFGSNPITTYAIEYDFDQKEIVTPEVDPDDRELEVVLEKVWDVYKDFSALQLRNMTHDLDTPWSNHYQGDYINKPIPNEEIQQHFIDVIKGMLGNERQSPK